MVQTKIMDVELTLSMMEVTYLEMALEIAIETKAETLLILGNNNKGSDDDVRQVVKSQLHALSMLKRKINKEVEQ